MPSVRTTLPGPTACLLPWTENDTGYALHARVRDFPDATEVLAATLKKLAATAGLRERDPRSDAHAKLHRDTGWFYRIRCEGETISQVAQAETDQLDTPDCVIDESTVRKGIRRIERLLTLPRVL